MKSLFAYKKATQAVNFFARKEGGKISKMKALKLIFFADRYHFRKYGRLITSDKYFAMEHGPVPSSTKHLVDMNEAQHRLGRDYAERFVQPLSSSELQSISDVETKVLSKTDLEALEFAWSKFGRMTAGSLRNLTHSYPEWEKRKRQLLQGPKKAVKIDLLDFLEEPAGGADPCSAVDDRRRTAIREFVQQTQSVEKILY